MKYNELIENAETIGPVYHGTNSEFSTFSQETVGSNLGFDSTGFFFTSDISIAKTYGSKIITAFVKLNNPFTLDDAFLHLPSSYDDEFEENGATITEYYDMFSTKIISIAKQQGNDGVLFEDFGEQLVVAFSVDQILSDLQ